jgi:hypothetical protein
MTNTSFKNGLGIGHMRCQVWVHRTLFVKPLKTGCANRWLRCCNGHHHRTGKLFCQSRCQGGHGLCGAASAMKKEKKLSGWKSGLLDNEGVRGHDSRGFRGVASGRVVQGQSSLPLDATEGGGCFIKSTRWRGSVQRSRSAGAGFLFQVHGGVAAVRQGLDGVLLLGPGDTHTDAALKTRAER